MGPVVVDAGVVIGFLDVADAHHRGAAAALHGHGESDLRMPASAYAEALIGPSRAGTTELAREAIHAVGLRIDSIDEAAAEEAARLRARHRSLRLPDALVLGYAVAIGADLILTTDRSWPRFSANVEVV